MRIERPHRVTHTHVQRLEVEPGRVFPLLCPVRETEWVEGWDPRVVYTESGTAERDCVFLMPRDGDDDVWVVSVYRPSEWRIEFVKLTPAELVTHVRFRLAEPEPGTTEVRIEYAYTALGAAGRQRVDAMSAEAFAEFMRSEWDRQMSAFLASGSGPAD